MGSYGQIGGQHHQRGHVVLEIQSRIFVEYLLCAEYFQGTRQGRKPTLAELTFW